jgi:hypothetical protein
MENQISPALQALETPAPSGIAVYDDFIEEPLLEGVVGIIRQQGFRYGWKSNKQVIFSHWNLGFTPTGTDSRNQKDIRSELPEPVLKLWESFQPIVLPGHPVLIRAYSNAYTYGNDGYIHQDSNSAEEITAIIYVNKGWNANWAGETAIFSQSGEIIRSILPKWRRLLIFPANSFHVGRAVSRICPQLRTVLVFKARPEGVITEDTPREDLKKALLEAGADKHFHSGRLLSDHLLGTYDLLKTWECEEAVCLAGGLHSIYGTNTYSTETLSEVYRPRVQQRFGEEAERLAWLFGSLERRKAFEGGITINRRNNTSMIIEAHDFHSLMLIEAANQMEQGKSLEQLPDVRKAMGEQITKKAKTF